MTVIILSVCILILAWMVNDFRKGIVILSNLVLEMNEKIKEVEFKYGEIELLRHNLNTTMKKYQDEIKENKELRKRITD
ncbi:MAG: hypothetical protein ACRCXT_06895 [Paraclostridium sp.]